MSQSNDSVSTLRPTEVPEGHPKPTKLILFSGGVESTALLNFINEDNINDITALTFMCPHRRDTYNSFVIEEIKKHKKFNHTSVITNDFSKMSGMGRYYYRHQLETFAPILYTILKHYRDIKEVWYGICVEDLKKIGKHPPIESMYRRMEGLVESINVKWLTPLSIYTKKQQYMMIPEEYRYITQSCMNTQIDDSDIYIEPCGTCYKCQERIEWMGDYK